MSKIKSIIGIKSLDRKLSKIANIDLTQSLNECCLLVENDAKVRCPVDEGNLRRSITHEVDGNTGIVGTNVSYAPYVESGTGLFSSQGNGRQDRWSYQDAQGNWYSTIGQKPQPYLHPALRHNKKQIRQTLKEEARKEINKYGI